MTSKYKQPGDVIDYTATAAIASGDVVVIGTKVGVALGAIANGSVGSVQVVGVFTLAKKSADVVAQGAALYWDAANKYLTVTSSGNTLAGYAFNAAAAGIAVADVKLNA